MSDASQPGLPIDLIAALDRVAVPAALCTLTDSGLAVIDGNPAFFELTGFSRLNVIGCDLLSLPWPEAADQIPLCFGLPAAEPSTRSRQVSIERSVVAIRRAGGELAWYAVVPRPLRSDDGGDTGLVIAALEDVTPVRAAYDELRQYEYILSSVSDGKCLVGADYKVRWVNQAWLDMFGFSMEQVLGKTSVALFGEGRFERDIKPYFDRALVGERVVFQLWNELPGRGRRCLDKRYDPLFDPLGAVYAVIATTRDVTDQVRLDSLLKQTQRAAKVAGWEWDCLTGELFWTDEAFRLHGVDRAQFELGLEAMLNFFTPHSRPHVRNAFENALRYNDNFDLEAELDAADGRRVAVRVIGNCVEASGQTLRVCGSTQDISDQKVVRSQLKLASQVFEKSGEAILITDVEWRVFAVNQAFTRITGYTEWEIWGETLPTLESGLQDADFYTGITKELEASGYWQGERWNRRKNGEIYPEWLTITAVKDEYELVTHYISIFSDLTERKAVEQKAEQLANYDFLTGLPNRSLMTDRINQAVALARRHGQKVGVLFIDLDRFKNVNDSLGHPVGDILLQEMARRIQSSVRASDTTARYSGDEFVVVAPDIAEPQNAVTIARKLIHAIGQPFTVDQHVLILGASVGIALFPDHGGDTPALLRNADAALNHAKALGRNNFQFFTAELNARTTEYMRMESNLRRAIVHGELCLYYQPKVSLTDGRLVGMEALVRWNHPTEGLIPPGRFIPVAEDTGLIVPLGAWVIKEACRQNRAWQLEGLPAIPVAVNISGIQFRQNLIATVQEALQHSGLAPGCLELEVTESVIMHDADYVVSMLHELKRMGVQLSIDDFGTGYSSLSYLGRFPIDKLKVDRSFLTDTSAGSETAPIAKAIINLARSLGLRVIAEGVENTDQIDFLREHQCDEIQGFFISRPVPADEARQLLGRRHLLCTPPQQVLPFEGDEATG